MADGQNTHVVGSVAEADGNLKRSIQMAFFAKKKDHTEIAMYHATLNDPDSGGKTNALFTGKDGADRLAIAKNGKALGQIIGVVFDVQEKEGTLPDGSKKMSLLAIGDFEAVNYATGEVVNSGAAYLPGYFADTLKGYQKATSGQPVELAVEIILTPTGKPIPTAYEVRPLIKRPADSPLNRIKESLQAAGRLRLPPPVARTVVAIEGTIDPDTSGGEPEFEDEGEGEQASADKAKGGKVKEPAAT